MCEAEQLHRLPFHCVVQAPTRTLLTHDMRKQLGKFGAGNRTNTSASQYIPRGTGCKKKLITGPRLWTFVHNTTNVFYIQLYIGANVAYFNAKIRRRSHSFNDLRHD